MSERDEFADLAELVMRRAEHRFRVPTVRPATVISAALAADVTARVQLDGPADEPTIDAFKPDTAFSANDRVLVLLIAPHGAFILWRFP